jgi:NADPH:quinone reductase-like Zn-dependent oxidoreductase
MSAPHLVNPKQLAGPTTGLKALAVRTTGGSSIDELIFDHVPVPEPGSAQVLVAIKAVSLNYRDLAVVTGRYPRDASQPTIIASDCCGEVMAVGNAVTAFQAGDRVAGSFFQKWIAGPFVRE